MSTIDELERKIDRLEQDILRQQELTRDALAKSEKSVDYAMHAYRIDHAGYVWVWDSEMQQYRKSDVCVRVIIPKVKTKEIINTKIDDKAVDNRTLDDAAVGSRNIQEGAVKANHIALRAVKSDLIDLKAIINELMADDAVQTRNIKDRNVTGSKIARGNIDTEHLKDQSVSADKLGSDVKGAIVMPPVNAVDQKFTNITEELYDMIASLQVGGIALSNQFGDRTDIGITQKALTRMFGAIWDKIAEYHPGQDFFDFTLTVNPMYIFNEIVEDQVNVVADCSQAISNFDSIRVYVDDELEPRAESSDVSHFETTVIITKTSTIRVVGTILGRVIEKTQTIINEIPFFMGGGAGYQEIVTEEYRKELVGTLEGDYDLVVKEDGQHMFIIIPASKKGDFRRANMKTPDMGGFEIPLDLIFENQDYVVYKSKAEQGYLAGTYNIDININS